MFDSLCSVWGCSVHSTKFPMLKIFKSLVLPMFPSSFNQLYVKYGNQGEYVKYGNQGEYRPLLFLGDLPNFKNIRHFDNNSPLGYITITAVPL